MTGEVTGVPRPTAEDPLRLLVAGSSVTFMMVPPRRSRDEATFGELLPRELRRRGVPAVGTVRGQWFGTIRDLRRRYEPAVRNVFPDVLVLVYGMAECQGRVLPTWLARHLTTWDVGGSALSREYRRRLAPTAWRTLRAWQRWAHPRVGARTSRLSPGRFRRELAHVVDMVRTEVRPLVLVLDILPAGPRLTHWMPGLQARVDRYNRVLADLVATYADDEVRLVRVSQVAAALGTDVATPDGMHLSAAGHRAVAQLLADEVDAWLAR